MTFSIEVKIDLELIAVVSLAVLMNHITCVIE